MDDPRSPWSTPSKSEYGTGEGFLELKESMILDADEEGEEEGRRQEEEEVVATLFVREMGDGEPSAEEMMPVEEAAPPTPENDQVMDQKQQQQQQQQEEIEEDQNEPPEVFENDSCVPVMPDSHCLDRDLDAVSSQGSSSGKDGNGGERDGARSQSRDPLVLRDRRRLSKRDVYPGGESRSPSPTKPFRKGSKGIGLKTKQSRHHQQQQQQLLQQQKKQKQRRSQSMDKSSVAPRLLLSELSVSETVGERLLLSPQQTQQQHQQTQDMGIQSKFSRSMNNVSSSSNASSAVSGGGPDSPRKKRQQIYRGIPKSRLRGGSEDSSTSSFRRKGSESSGSGPTSAATAAAAAPSGASVTGSSNSSPKKSPRKQKSEAGAAAAGSSGDQLISSPKKSVKKKKKKRTARDVIELPFPYNTIKSDDLKYWCKELAATKKLDVEADRNQLVKDLAFTNAMVLKMNQIAKQGLLNRMVLFGFACYISEYDIAEKELKKASNSFLSFARQLTSIRENIETAAQKQMFDLEECSWVPPGWAAKPIPRPNTAKPKDPDTYEFADEEIAADYRNLWEKYQELQQLKNSAASVATHNAEDQLKEMMAEDKGK